VQREGDREELVALHACPGLQEDRVWDIHCGTYIVGHTLWDIHCGTYIVGHTLWDIQCGTYSVGSAVSVSIVWETCQASVRHSQRVATILTQHCTRTHSNNALIHTQ
jgi:hypothetical protein